ncbi:hypothetical protein H312_00752, partial [Anncaliia algerae PRA339]
SYTFSNHHNIYSEVAPIEITYIVGTTAIKATKKIFPLQTTELSTNAIKWANDFKVTCSLANWTTLEALEVLKNLFATDILSSTIVNEDLDASLDHLRLFEIGSQSLNILLNNLKDIKQINFTFIQDYYNVIFEIIKKLAPPKKTQRQRQIIKYLNHF